MILKNITGCICDSLTVDGVEEIDLPNDEIRKEILNKIGDFVSKLKEEDYSTYTRENLACNLEGDLDYEEDSLLQKSFKELGEIIKKVAEPRHLNYILQSVLANFGKIIREEEPCPCCGDTVREYILEIQD